MKKINWIFILLIALYTAPLITSCKNKTKEPATQEEKKTEAPVEVSSDATLRISVDNIIKSFPELHAEVKDGVVTLHGSLKSQDEMQTIIMKVHELKPKKVENQIVIKTS